MNRVYKTQPSTIDDLKFIVNEFTRNMDSEMMSKACKSAPARFMKVRETKGDNFEHLLCFYPNFFGVV